MGFDALVHVAHRKATTKRNETRRRDGNQTEIINKPINISDLFKWAPQIIKLLKIGVNDFLFFVSWMSLLLLLVFRLQNAVSDLDQPKRHGSLSIYDVIEMPRWIVYWIKFSSHLWIKLS